MIDLSGRGMPWRPPHASSWRAFFPVVVSLSALCAATPGIADAQASGALPDTIPLPLLADSAPGYLSRLGRLDNAVQMTSELYQVVVAAAPTAAQLDADRRRGAPMDACPFSPRPGAMPGEADQIVGRNSAELLVVVVTAARRGEDACEQRWNTTMAAVWRGAFYPDSNGRAAAIPAALVLEADGRPVAPVASVSLPAYEWRSNAWVRAGPQLRYYYDLRVLGSRPDSGAPALTVRVRGSGGASPSSFVLSDAGVSQLADEYLIWRFASREEQPRLRVALQPRAAVTGTLERALAEGRDGRVVRGGLDAAAFLATARTSPGYERAVARAFVADAEHRLGDRTRARTMVAAMQREAPCLRLPAGAEPALQAFADSLRKGSCESQPLRRMALTGLAVPGGAHYATGSRATGRIVTGVVASLFVRALLQERAAQSRYAQYESATTSSEAYAFYASAADTRARARSTAWAAVAAWLLDDVLALGSSDSRNRRIARDRL